GATLAARPAWNQAYYGRPLTPSDILVRGQGANLQGEALVATVQRVVRGSAERDRGSADASAAQAGTTVSPRPTLGGSRSSSRLPGGWGGGFNGWGLGPAPPPRADSPPWWCAHGRACPTPAPRAGAPGGAAGDAVRDRSRSPRSAFTAPPVMPRWSPRSTIWE